MDKAVKAHQLARRIRESMGKASVDQKRKFAHLLEKHLEQEATPIKEAKQYSREELEAVLKDLETILIETAQFVKQSKYVLNEVKMDLEKAIHGIDQLPEDLMDDVEEAIDRSHSYVDGASGALYQVEVEIKQAIKRIGWQIHDIDNAQALEESGGEIDAEVYDKGYKAYQMGQTNCPYKQTTPNHRAWREGWAAAAREAGK
jgi:hypothetical protein